jgi:hypothetical protein
MGSRFGVSLVLAACAGRAANSPASESSAPLRAVDATAATTSVGSLDEERRSGVVVHGPGELTGVVVDDGGRALADFAVHVAMRGGEHVVKSDRAGRYHVELRDDSPVYVFARGARVSATIGVEAYVDGVEAIELHDVVAPAVQAKARTDPRRIPPYSQRAIDANAWARAWVLLDVAPTGAVERVQLVRDPGFELGPIAVRAALRLDIAPARDAAGRPMRALLLWSFEWPAYYWMMDQHASFARVPASVDGVPCAGSGPTHTLYRDCSPPDLAHAVALPWISS